MATYVIGDIQGCDEPFQRLLTQIQFNDNKDQLWLAGDLVNRGPASKSVLSFLYERRNNCVIVLGNHDLHLLALIENIYPAKNSDTVQDILQSSKAAQWSAWLRQQKLAHYSESHKILLTHAGVMPQWTLSEVLAFAHEIESALRGEQYIDFLKNFRGNLPDQWDPRYQDMERLRILTQYFTQMRFCDAHGKLDFHAKATTPTHPHFKPWFLWPRKIDPAITLLFGHWAALEGKTGVPHAICVDTGCVWGNRLSALRLEDRLWFSVPAH